MTGSTWRPHRLGLLHEYAQTAPDFEAVAVDQFDRAVSRLDLVPELVDPTIGVRRADDDVVKDDQSARPDQRAVHLEIGFDPLVSVVAVDEEEIHPLAAESPFR